MVPAALDAAFQALDRRLDPEARAPLIVALSGGSDSLALMRLAGLWAEAARRPLQALTVDHGLHPDSAAWTAAAGDAARSLGASWQGLAWDGPKPTAGLPAAARRARHALLAEAARCTGARVILFGHTADDVLESDLIRLATPTHGRLAEWAPSPAWPQGRGLFILRPLLGMGRAELQAWLASEGLAWLDDPANADPRFARSRARRTLAEAAAGLDAPGAAAPPSTPSRVSAIPTALRRAAPPRNSGVLDPALLDWGVLDLDLAWLRAREGSADTLAKALLCISGRSRPPAGVALERLLARLGAADPVTATLAGGRVQRQAGRLRLTRELGRAPPAPLRLGHPHAEVFDGRFEVWGQAPGWRVGPLSGHAAALPKREREALHTAPAEARASLPALFGPGAEVRLPGPFGGGPATVRPLMAGRLAAAWGWMEHERALQGA